VSRRPTIAGIILAVALSGCGTSGASGSGGSAHPVRLTALAASSLTNVLPKIGRDFTRSHPGVTVSFSFGGTDSLTAQIEQGAPADVFAGASLKYGDQLAGEHLIDPYRPFCTNRLVLVLPPSNPAAIASPADLAKPGIKLVVAAETVPVGAYTRKVLTNLDATYGGGYDGKVLANVVSNEDSVESVLTKVSLGEADAGFVYVTDSKAAGAAVRTIELPEEAQAVATYPAAVVSASTNRTVAKEFVDFLLGGTAQELLQRAAFGPPPAS
jgi:molybdate transport system substrate-binding protein